MEFRNYKTLPSNVKEQIGKVTDTWLKCIGESVIGIYIQPVYIILVIIQKIFQRR